MDVDEEAAATSFKAYYRLLRDNRAFTVLWIGEIVDNIGNWLNYIASLTLVETLAGGRGLLISAVLIVRFLPTFLLFPVAGVVADRFDRPKVMLCSAAVNIFVVLGLALIQKPSDIWAMYLLLFLQFSSSTFYDPARRALEPTIIHRKQLHLGTTMDTFAWSVTVAIGSSLGGTVVSKLGTTMCFVLDSLTYIVASACVILLQTLLKRDGYIGLQSQQTSDSQEAEQLLGSIDSPARVSNTIPELASVSQITALNSIAAELSTVSLYDQQQPSTEQGAAVQSSPESSSHEYSDNENADPNQLPRQAQVELQPLGKPQRPFADCEDHNQPRSSNHMPTDGYEEDPAERIASAKDASTSRSALALILQDGFAEGVISVKEAVVYILRRDNRQVAVLCFIKFSGALVWGAADILQVKYSEMPIMQSLGDGPQTLGLVFASVGVGCFFGPILFNWFTPPRKPQLLRSTAASFYCLMFGYLLLVVAADIKLLLLSTAIRSAGSAVLWIYSTLMLQFAVPNELLGRVLALEMALFTVSDAVSAVFGGAAFDVLHLSVRQVSGIMTVVGAGCCLVWTLYAWWQCRHLAQEKNASSEASQTQA